ncbi:MAG: response regulator transcription factor, partial [Verrucomicrobia bacterium]|nr:response regulator transcription factor [Verrucomicrobiota bacterium]
PTYHYLYSNNMTLLLAEDDPELARQILDWLAKAGHDVTWHDDGAVAEKTAMGKAFDAIILDVNLPNRNGFQIVESLREARDLVPVLFLTARAGVTDRVRGLASGGDDYLTKPFAMEELLARLKALNRRYQQSGTGRRRIGEWTLDSRQRRLKNATDGIDLQPRECALLEMLLDHEGHTLTKKFLLDKVWNLRFDPGTNVVDAVICRLRRKLDAPGHASCIQTVRGKGYVLKAVS